MVEVLLGAGCVLNRADQSGASPLITCVRYGHVETVRMMANQSGVDLEWTDNERRTALILAAQLNHSDILHDLITAGIGAPVLLLLCRLL